MSFCNIFPAFHGLHSLFEERERGEDGGGKERKREGQNVSNCHGHYRKPKMGNRPVFICKKMLQMVKLLF